MKHLVQFSTGAGSAEVALRVVEQFSEDNTVLITADTMAEDVDNWRFAQEVVRFLGYPEWVILKDGRTPMQVGMDLRVVPNNRMAVCSRVLKREIIREHMDATYNPAESVVYLGFDWTEEHRLAASEGPWEPWTIAAPLMDPPYVDKATILDSWRARGIEPPRLYAEGFAHANCGGCCVRSGQAQWEVVLRVHPDRYEQWENDEESIRTELGKDVSILRDRIGLGPARPLSLKKFRLRLQSAPSLFDNDDWGACGCTDEEP